MANRSNQNLLHRIFKAHGFKNPPEDPIIIMDVSFAKGAVEMGLNPEDCLNEIPHTGDVKLVSTECLMNELRDAAKSKPVAEESGTEENVLAGIVPKKVQVKSCLHSEKQQYSNPKGCLVASLLGKKNPKKYMLATLRSFDIAEAVYGLPIITLKGRRAVFRQPHSAQVDYYNTTTDERIKEEASADLKAMKCRKKNKKQRARNN